MHIFIYKLNMYVYAASIYEYKLVYVSDVFGEVNNYHCFERREAFNAGYTNDCV